MLEAYLDNDYISLFKKYLLVWNIKYRDDTYGSYLDLVGLGGDDFKRFMYNYTNVTANQPKLLDSDIDISSEIAAVSVRILGVNKNIVALLV